MTLFLNNIWLRRFLIAIGLFVAGIWFFWTSVYLGVWGALPSKEELSNIKQAEASLIFDANSELLGKFFIFDRQIVAFEELPKNLINALVATEDARFYQHSGVDYKSFFRVFFKSLLLQDESSGGGSTISQQLVKNLYGRKELGPLTLPVSKVKEMMIAKRVENVYSKEEILALYFNTVPFSDNTFGIESAARKFYNTTASQLTLAQCATLVGTLKASHSYNPRLYPERSQLRRDIVLQQMEKYGYIDEKIQHGANNNLIEIDYQYFDNDEGIAPYFREKLRLDVGKLLDTLSKPDGSKYDLYKDGLKIYTTLDNKLQEYAEKAMKEHMQKLQAQFEKAYGKNAPWISGDIFKKHLESNAQYKALLAKGLDEKDIMASLENKSEMHLFAWEGDNIEMTSTVDSLRHYLKFLNTGFIAIEPQTGAIKSYIGGIDYEHYKYDHVSMSKRQVGSTFKPFVYTAAIESGMPPCTYFAVKPVMYSDKGDWMPTNSSKIENEDQLNYSLEKALSNSVNTIAVKVLKQVRIEPVIALTRRMGITSDIPKVPSIALGTAELSLLELATAYTGFANKSVSPDAYFVNRIEDKKGNIIFEYKPKRVKPAFSETTRQVMVEMMKATINSGTATRIRNTYGLPNDMAGKTGTTQDNRDGWFVGITPKLVMATWVGHDDHRIGFKSTYIGQGANSALPMVALFLKEVNKDPAFNEISNAKFPRPSADVVASLDCDPEYEDGFFRRLFSNDEPDRKFQKKERKKKGFFGFLKKKDN
ncbi:penicillin-binding protein 1A [Flavobacteriaceae bacterium MAR_2010_188]|nr:penicillin-binding protein 1A [Flavobacteriaceae bacterium MAR_2010_188]